MPVWTWGCLLPGELEALASDLAAATVGSREDPPDDATTGHGAVNEEQPSGAPAWPADPERMLQVLADNLATGGNVTDDDRRRASELLHELGVSELLRIAALSERIIRAADGFHAVAGFFVEGSDERAYILEVLRRAREGR